MASAIGTLELTLVPYQMLMLCLKRVSLWENCSALPVRMDLLLNSVCSVIAKEYVPSLCWKIYAHLQLKAWLFPDFSQEALVSLLILDLFLQEKFTVFSHVFVIFFSPLILILLLKFSKDLSHPLNMDVKVYFSSSFLITRCKGNMTYLLLQGIVLYVPSN